ncbi:hypothetical protein EV200_106309 [Pedobacter psychrotolerans]|uniref:Uncharacterized protein n=1 Tax=Pedobacter psychrotolerans TaxID=1843235 RepID=A0A4R2H814_9SPHI|nr:hypothetical protein EV200_106309 [Pedobacter psychrotolerans]
MIKIIISKMMRLFVIIGTKAPLHKKYLNVFKNEPMIINRLINQYSSIFHLFLFATALSESYICNTLKKTATF